MLALSLGLTAAVIWAVHDLLVRKLSQGVALLPIVLVVLASGSLVLLAPALALGEWAGLSGRAIWLACAAGTTFAVAIGSLYRAFSMAPVRVVSPIIGAYPMISLSAAVAQGRPVTLWDWFSVLAVVLGHRQNLDAEDQDRVPERHRHVLHPIGPADHPGVVTGVRVRHAHAHEVTLDILFGLHALLRPGQRTA